MAGEPDLLLLIFSRAWVWRIIIAYHLMLDETMG